MKTPTRAPVAEWVEAGQLLRDPYSTYARLRREAPIAFVPHMNRYFVTTFRECFDVEMDQATFSSRENADHSTMIRSMGRPLLRKDDPAHKDERNAMAPALRPVAIKKHWNAVFRANAEKYIRRLRDAGSEADLCRDFAVPYAADNPGSVIGLHNIAAEQMMHWSHTLIAGTANVTDDPAVWVETDSVRAQIDEAIDRALARISGGPEPSMISAMLSAGLDEESLRANVRLTISGGMNEPSHVISSAVWALSAFPDQRELVLAGRRTWRDVFEETARFQSPVGMYPRRATRETILNGVLIPEDATLALIVASANRDEARFDRPEVFDLNRDSTSHLAFGNGTHICAGNWVARAMVGEIALPALYSAFPGLTAVEPDKTDFHGWVFRGIRSLPVALSA
ncbi:MAG TPA: cytochrome P450 [Arthrobacter sp.]|nr:cytochrome P450 [Arthrobacter sp.]